MLNSNVCEVDHAASSLQLSPSRSLGEHPSPSVAGHPRPRDDAAVAGLRPARPARPPAPPKPAPNTATAETVLKAFNTWAFKREQPADPQVMHDAVTRAITNAEPISFVLYWGKGPRRLLDAPDLECLEHLAAMAARIKASYPPGAALKLIFTDTHATLNGYSAEEMRDYFFDVDAAAHQRGFDSCLLSELTMRAGDVADEAAGETVSDEMLVRLCASALKWYRGGETPKQGALRYFRMNMVEKRAVERAFPNAIFATFNGSKFRCLFPEHMPIFYMYSLRRGVSVKPWFLPADAKRSEAAPPGAEAIPKAG
jgi:hypothetical protein